MFRQRQKLAELEGRERTEAHEEEYVAKKEALAKLDENVICPVENCESKLTSGARKWNSRLFAWICAAYFLTDDGPRTKPKEVHRTPQSTGVPKPAVCSTNWCTNTDKAKFI